MGVPGLGPKQQFTVYQNGKLDVIKKPLGFFDNILRYINQFIYRGAKALHLRSIVQRLETSASDTEITTIANTVFSSLQKGHPVSSHERDEMRVKAALALFNKGDYEGVMRFSRQATSPAEREIYLQAVSKNNAISLTPERMTAQRAAAEKAGVNFGALKYGKLVARASPSGGPTAPRPTAPRLDEDPTHVKTDSASPLPTRPASPIKVAPLTGVSRPLAVSGSKAQGQDQTCYFALDQIPIWNFVDWSVNPPVMNQESLNSYIATISARMKENGITHVNFSFGQLANISAYASATPWAESYSPDDSIGMIYKSTVGVQQNVLSMITGAFQENGMATCLSVGGATGGPQDWTIQGDPATQASTFATWIKSMGFTSVDFDIENDSYTSTNTPTAIQSFFSTLSSSLGSSVPMSLTVLTATSNASSLYQPFFGPPTSNFNNWFASLNLMYYNGQYYLDPVNGGAVSWGLSNWLDIVGKENAGKVHVGFTDGVVYNQANCGSGNWAQYSVPAGATSGVAAATIYAYLIRYLQNNGYISSPSDLGQPMWWPSQAVDSYGNPAQFVSTAMTDFFTELARTFPPSSATRGPAR